MGMTTGPAEMMMMSKQSKSILNKVAKSLKKASKSHANQAKNLAKATKMLGGGKAKSSPMNAVKMAKGGTKSRVNEAGNYTKPALRKRIFNAVKAGGKGGAPGQWSARKAQLTAARYKKAGGGYRD